MAHTPDAAYVPRVGRESLEDKLAANGRKTGDEAYLLPSWAEVREVMRDLDRCRGELKWAFANAAPLADGRVGLKERVRRLNRFRDHIDAVIYPREEAEQNG